MDMCHLCLENEATQSDGVCGECSRAFPLPEKPRYRSLGYDDIIIDTDEQLDCYCENWNLVKEWMVGASAGRIYDNNCNALTIRRQKNKPQAPTKLAKGFAN